MFLKRSSFSSFVQGYLLPYYSAMSTTGHTYTEICL